MEKTVRTTDVTPESASPVFRVLNGHAYFNGNCEACRPFCAAVCCRGYGWVPLTPEEAKSGRYTYKEVSETCGCESCVNLRKQGARYILAKLPDGSCVYLDGLRKCTIYRDRPEVCRNYTCVNVAFGLAPSSR